MGISDSDRLFRKEANQSQFDKSFGLKSICQELSQPARPSEISRRIQLCQLALELVSRQQNPTLWAALKIELGNNLARNPLGIHADNIEQAIIYYEQALKVCTKKDFPELWAKIQNDLAEAYWVRIREDRTENVEKAIEHCHQALKIYTLEGFPADWATIQNNLALAYNNRIRDDRAENIEKAIEHYHQALIIRTQEDFPTDWAATQNNLANAYIDRIRGERAENIELAIEHYHLALKIRTQKDFPADWAMTQNNLAAAYKNRIRGERAESIEQAVWHYKQALKMFTPGEFPNYCRGTAYRLGNLCLEASSLGKLERERFSIAGKAYSQGMNADNELYTAAIFQSSRDAELAETRDLYRRAGYAHALSGEMMDAVVTLERGRARGLGLSLARDRADMERVREKDPESHQLYWQMVADLQNLESQERVGVSADGKASPTLRDLMMQARTRLSEVLDRIRRIQGYESFLKEPDWQEIAISVIVGQPLVYLAAAPAGGVALIVHRSPESKDATVDSVILDGFSEQRLQELLKIWFDAYGGWQKSRTDFIEKNIEAVEYLQAQGRWFDAIEMVTGQLWQDVMGLVFGILQSLKAQQAFLIPMGLLSLLPLHAAWKIEGGQRQYLQDLLPVSYVPSARSLAHARSMASSAESEKLLAVDEPRPVKALPLRNSNAEVSAISSLFKDRQILEHEKATRSAALQALPDVEVAHFSCHGRANWSDPVKSGLLMANNEILTVKDLFELHLAEARLATLSACETGVPGTKLPDEVISLPSAFIRAGFAGAIGSLWAVHEKSTAQLMTSFYQLWRQKRLTPVQALTEAQKRLRESEEFGHPFYWAAFYLTGV